MPPPLQKRAYFNSSEHHLLKALLEQAEVREGVLRSQAVSFIAPLLSRCTSWQAIKSWVQLGRTPCKGYDCYLSGFSLSLQPYTTTCNMNKTMRQVSSIRPSLHDTYQSQVICTAQDCFWGERWGWTANEKWTGRIGKTNGIARRQVRYSHLPTHFHLWM